MILTRQAMGEPFEPFFELRVRREHLAHDALSQIANAHPYELQKPLRVQFVGEEGVDEGGLKRELFADVVQQCVAPEHGLFEFVRETGAWWFRRDAVPVADRNDYFLVGLLVGLALYNAVLLPIAFPRVLYKVRRAACRALTR